jgi:malate dehydrogenase (oxaloacetate-decarboxylating)
MPCLAAGHKLASMVTIAHPSAQFSATLRVRLANRPGAFAAFAAAVAEHDGLLDAIDLVRVEDGTKVRDVTVLATDAGHIDRIVDAVRELGGVFVEHVSDRTFLLHLGGKLEVVAKTPLAADYVIPSVFNRDVAPAVARAVAGAAVRSGVARREWRS